MKRKWLFAITAVTAALASTLLSTPILVSQLSRGPTINREKFDRIKLGMTEEEVETVLGVRPGYYASKLVLCPPPPVRCRDASCWCGEDGFLEVRWESGRVCSKMFSNVQRTEQNSFESLRWHFRNGWRKLFGS